jgi:hypothetical protein
MMPRKHSSLDHPTALLQCKLEMQRWIVGEIVLPPSVASDKHKRRILLPICRIPFAI